MKKFNTLAFAAACGVTWGLGVFALSLMSHWWGIASPIVALIGSGYAGYDATVGGAFIGLIWGFVDAFVGGAIFAWLYNVIGEKLK